MLSREQVLRQIRENVHHPATSRELLQILRVPRTERPTFRRLLKALVSDGDLLQIRGNRFGLADRMDVVVGRLQMHQAGYGFVVADAERDGGDLYIAPTNVKEALHGDRVVARVEHQRGDRAEGRIIRILERANATIVGRYEVDDRSMGFVVPFDRRVLADVQVPPEERREAEAGDMVVVELTRWPTATRPPLGRVIEVLGPVDTPGVDTRIIIRKHALPDVHGEDAIAEATTLGTSVRPADLDGRTDFRSQPTVTIDGEHARDFDDAITLERLANGHYWLGVHIADVSHYVEEGSALDAEAYERGTSVYFPERAIHMFPAELATGLCSLKPHVDRLVQSCLMEVTRNGDVVRVEFHDGVINSNERMTYTDVNAILTARDAATRARYAPLLPLFDLMHELFGALNGRRRRRGSVDFDLPQAEVLMDESGRIENIIIAERNVAHRLIEEFMLLANETVADFLEEKRRARAVSHSRRAGPAEGRAVRGVHLRVRPFARRAAQRAAAPALSAAHREDHRHARRAAGGLPDAQDHAEGALCPGEPGALRPGGVQLHALHLADSPLSRPGRAPSAARAPPRRDRRDAARGDRRGTARGRAPHLRARAPRRRRRAGIAAVAQGAVHGRQGRRRVRRLHHGRGRLRAVHRAGRALRRGARAHLQHGRRLLPVSREQPHAARREHAQGLPARRQGARAADSRGPRAAPDRPRAHRDPRRHPRGRGPARAATRARPTPKVEQRRAKSKSRPGKRERAAKKAVRGRGGK